MKVKNFKKVVFVVIFLLFALFSFAKEKEESKIQPKKYTRIVTLTLSGDEMILALVEPWRIAGLSGKINEDPSVSYIVDEAKKFPKVESNIEKMIDLEPDLVIAGDWMKKEYLKMVEDSGVDTYIYKTPTSFQEQKNLIVQLGELVGEKARGMEIAQNMESRLETLQEKIAQKYEGDKPRILMYTSFETTSGENTTFDDMVKILGGINVASQWGIKRYEKISKEKIIEMNPEIIIFPVWKGENVDFLLNDPSFKEVDAIKNKRVLAVEYKVTSPTSQYMIDGIEELGRVIYGLEVK